MESDIKKESSSVPKKVDIVYRQDTEVKAGLIKIWRSIPIFIKFLTLSSIILYILNLFLPFIAYILSNIPLYSVNYFQVWRLITSVFITTNIYNLILGLLFWVRDAASLETSLGTIKYMLIFFRNSILIQILYTAVISLVAFITKNKLFMAAKCQNYLVTNSGFWPMLMCEITLLCLCNPNTNVQFLFIPLKFKAKYYPFIWFAFFCVGNGLHNDLEVLVGIGYAFLFQLFLKKWLNISDSFIEKLENNFAFKWMKTINSFVSVSHITNKFPIQNVINVQMMGKFNKNKSKENNDDLNKNSDLSSNYSERDINIASDYEIQTDQTDGSTTLSGNASAGLDQ